MDASARVPILSNERPRFASAEQPPEPFGTYVEAVQTGDLLFLSEMLPTEGHRESNSEEATRKNLREFYKMVIPASSIAGAIAYAIDQPAEVEIDEMVIRPTAQDF